MLKKPRVVAERQTDSSNNWNCYKAPKNHSSRYEGGIECAYGSPTLVISGNTKSGQVFQGCKWLSFIHRAPTSVKMYFGNDCISTCTSSYSRPLN